MSAPSEPTVVYFNSACPVCNAGICELRERMPSADSVQWVDVHQNPELLRPLGLDLEAVRERLHVQTAGGEMQIGSDAIATLLERTPRRAWLGWLARRARWIAGPLYNLLARQLYRWNLRRGHWTP